jgi:hypothetical protein
MISTPKEGGKMAYIGQHRLVTEYNVFRWRWVCIDCDKTAYKVEDFNMMDCTND